MSRNEFQIEFAYEGVNYYGLVHAEGPASAPRYRVSLENENQEFFLEIHLVPAASDLEDWVFECEDGEDATAYYDRELLEAVGGQIDAHIHKKTGSGTLDD